MSSSDRAQWHLFPGCACPPVRLLHREPLHSAGCSDASKTNLQVPEVFKVNFALHPLLFRQVLERRGTVPIRKWVDTYEREGKRIITRPRASLSNNVVATSHKSLALVRLYLVRVCPHVGPLNLVRCIFCQTTIYYVTDQTQVIFCSWHPCLITL